MLGLRHRRTAQDLWKRTLAGASLGAAPMEQYRILAHTLDRAEPADQSRALVITSSLPGEGKTLTATNLALTLSGSFQRRVLLVDGDLRRPSLHDIFDGDGKPAPDDGLPADITLPFRFIRQSPTLAVLTTEGTDDPIRTIASDDMTALVAWARERYDWILIDSPPAALVPDARMLAELADGVLMVVWAASTPHEAARQAIASVGRERVLGVVMNRVKKKDASGSLRYYGDYTQAPRR